MTRLDRMKRGSGIKGRDDRSSGIEIRMTEALAKINPTDPVILTKKAARRNRNCSDSSGNSLARAEASRWACRNSRRLKSSKIRPAVSTDTDTRRSHAAYIIMMNGGPISWKSRRQDSVALSTSEAEYMAASEVGKEILYLRAILCDVGYAQTAPTNIYENNLACIAMSTNPVRRKSSRHIDIRVHFSRELYAAGASYVTHSSSDPPHGCRRPHQESCWPCSYSGLCRCAGPYSFLRSSSTLVSSLFVTSRWLDP